MSSSMYDYVKAVQENILSCLFLLSEAPSVCAVAPQVSFKLSKYNHVFINRSMVNLLKKRYTFVALTQYMKDKECTDEEADD